MKIYENELNVHNRDCQMRLLNYSLVKLPEVYVRYFRSCLFYYSSMSFIFAVCKLIKNGVAGIFGPSSQVSSGHVQSICNALSIPHVQTFWDARESRDYFSISLYPHYEVLGKAYVDLIKYWKWSTFTIIYEDNDGKFIFV